MAGPLASITAIAVLTALAVMRSAHVPGLFVLVLYLLVIVPTAILCDTRVAGVIAVLGAAVYENVFTLSFTPSALRTRNVIALGIFLVAAVVVGKLAVSVRQAARESARPNEAQSALLRVATRAAQSKPPAPVVDVVCRELGPLYSVDPAELSASRARVVAAADEVRRRLGRDLHDGVQQRLVSVGLKLRLACDAVPAQMSTLHTNLWQLSEEFNEAQEELRELARGLHPSILSKHGLVPALRTLARRSAIPMTLHVNTEARYPAPLELTAFYVVSEALTNTIKHANASWVQVVVEDRSTALVVSIRDNGGGGTDPRSGSGLIGLRDRVEAISGSMQITSLVAAGTTIHISLPIDQIDGAASDARRNS
ncbi:histidine kinase [Mycobacterium sp. URHB0021]